MKTTNHNFKAVGGGVSQFFLLYCLFESPTCPDFRMGSFFSNAKRFRFYGCSKFWRKRVKYRDLYRKWPINSYNCNNFSPKGPIWMKLSRMVELRGTKKTCFSDFSYFAHFLLTSAFSGQNNDFFAIITKKCWRKQKMGKIKKIWKTSFLGTP